MTEYRHECKYIIDEWQKEVLVSRLNQVMVLDSNASSQGTYVIRSLYFDDYNNSLYFENLDGVDVRSKYRIRYYGNDTEYIRLEKKSKCHGMTKKESCTITEKETLELILGNRRILSENSKKSKLFYEVAAKCLNPTTIVTYERIPYVYDVGNVRVTFDMNITSSTQVRDFLTRNYRQRPILGKGGCILEVKWDEILPTHIKEVLDVGDLQWGSFSKYASCVEYSI